MRRSLGLGLAVVIAATALSCAGRQEVRGQEVSGVDRKLSTFAFIEDGDLVYFVVGTKAAQYRAAGPYVPLEIAVANRGLKQLTLTRESFVLVDSEGHRYPCASPRELLEGYEYLDFDLNLLELESILSTKFAAMTRYPSKFSPSRQAVRGRPNLVRDLVSLPKFGYLYDVVYFPLPASGIAGQTFELFLQAPELPDPVFVRFDFPPTK